MDKYYFIKNAGAWMLDELFAFSEKTSYSVIFLRKQDPFFDDRLKILEGKGIKIHFIKRWDKFSFSKFYFCLMFGIRHILCFGNKYSFVYGLKGMVYFLKLDLNLFNKGQSDIHCQFATQSAILGLMLKEYYKSKVNYSFTYHAYDIYVNNLWFNTLGDEAKCIFSISNYNIDYVINNYSLKNKLKLKYSPLGVFPPVNIHKRRTDGLLRIGFLSYFVEMKGIDFLLPAIKELMGMNLNFSFEIAGDGPLKSRMISYVKQNNLTGNVIFHGLIKNEKKDLFFRNLDVFVLPSISKGMETDGLPVVLMEAVSYGLPIISTNVSGIPEICVNEYNGYLIEPGDSGEIVKAILKLNSNILSEFSINSFEISKKYNITDNSNQKLKLLGWN